MKKLLLLVIYIVTIIFCGLCWAATNVELSAPAQVIGGVKDSFALTVQWSDAPDDSEVFVILIEGDTGNNWAAAIDHDTGKEWWGSSYPLTSASGSMTITKSLTPYEYSRFSWIASIRDKNDEEAVYASQQVETQGRTGGNLTFTTPEQFTEGFVDDYALSFQWDSLPSGYDYELFYILLEGDTGNYWAGAQHKTGDDWTDWGGDTEEISDISGSWQVSKRLRVMSYEKLIWFAEIRDPNDTTRKYVTAIGSPKGQGNFAVSTDWYLAEGCTAGSFDEWVLVQNPNGATATCQVVFMKPDGNTIAQNISVPGTGRYTIHVNDVVPQESVSTKITSTNGVSVIAERAMYWDGGDVPWVGGHCSIGVTQTGSVWYLAEGCTGGGFDQWVLVQNPNESDAVCQVTFMKTDGSTVTQQITVPATGRYSIHVNELVPNASVATKIESTNSVKVIAERAMYWNSGGVDWVGGHCSVGITETSTTWYLAEGCTTGTFAEWVLLQNPNSQAAQCKITFMKTDGTTVEREVTVAATGRLSVYVNEHVPNESVSTKVTSTNGVGIIAERSMYWDAGGVAWAAGHCSVGVTDTSETWYVAEGCTAGGFDEYVLIQNPEDTAAQCRVTLMKTDGSIARSYVSVPATGRYTIHVNDLLPGESLSTKVETLNGIGVIVERAMYWSSASDSSYFTEDKTWIGGHCSRAAI